MATPLQDKGAIGTADRLEHYEAEAEREISQIGESIAALKAMLKPNAPIDDEEQLSLGLQIDKLRRERDDAFDRWLKLSKQVREYYKSVASDKREGEKIPRAEVEHILTQVWRFQRIGRETFIVSIAQDAVRCKDEQDFYTKYADGIRDCEREKLKSAIENEKFPEWVNECYESSL